MPPNTSKSNCFNNGDCMELINQCSHSGNVSSFNSRSMKDPQQSYSLNNDNGKTLKRKVAAVENGNSTHPIILD